MIEDRHVILELARSHFYSFLILVFNRLHQGQDQQFIPSPHVEAMCAALEDVDKRDAGRLVITVPPRHLKSITAAVAFVAWKLGHNPALKIMVASYGKDLASQHSRDCRAIMESPVYRLLFPQTRLIQATELELRTSMRGGRKAVSLAGAATGFGADFLLLDDLMKAADASSDTERQRVKDYYDQTLIPRLNDKAASTIISIQQRLHEDDLPAYLIEKGNFQHLNLPAIAERDEVIELGGGRVFQRKKGEALFPARESLEQLERLRTEIGEFSFACQYLQNPTPPGGNRIRWEWFRNYEDRPGRSKFQRVVQSWDTAMTAEPTSDWSVCTTWGFRDHRWDLLDVYRARLDYPDLKRAVLRQHECWSPEVILIEGANTGVPLAQELRLDLGPRAIRTYRPRTDKVARLEAQTARLESGYVRIPADAHWLDDFRKECMAFPHGRYDDQVDSMTQFIEWSVSRRAAAAAVERDPRTGRPLRVNRPQFSHFS